MNIVEYESLTNEMKQMIESDYLHVFGLNNVNYDVNKEVIMNNILKWFEKPSVEGVLCLENNVLVGFLLGDVMDDKVWVKPFGFSVKGEDVDKVIYSMYKYCSKKWFLRGHKFHVIESLNRIEYVESLQKLGFAHQQVHGILKIDEYKKQNSSQEISVRQLTKDDELLLRKMSSIIYKYQNDSPVYASAPKTVIDEISDGYANLVNDKELLFYLAEQDEPVAFQGLWPEEEGYLIPKNSIELSIAGTIETSAHKGVGSKLMDHVMGDILDKGYKWLITDWRMTNISSRRFWHDKCGFKVLKHRMTRYIGPDFVWGEFE